MPGGLQQLLLHSAQTHPGQCSMYPIIIRYIHEYYISFACVIMSSIHYIYILQAVSQDDNYEPMSGDDSDNYEPVSGVSVITACV